MTAAELIAVRARARLIRRVEWLASSRGDDDPAAEEAWQANQPEGEDRPAERRLAGPEGAAWARLVGLFGLTAAEEELLQLSLAVAIEPALGALIVAAQGGGGLSLPTEPLAKRLAGLPPRPIWRPTGALAMWALVRPVRGSPGDVLRFEADPRVVDWMFGTVTPDDVLTLAIRSIAPEPAPREWPVRATVRRLKRALERGGDVRLIIEGRAGSGRRLFAAAIAKLLKRQALLVNPAPLAPDDWAENFMRLQRFASFSGAALIWQRGAPSWPDKIALGPVQMICIDESEAPPARDGATDIVIALPEPGSESKAAAWRRLAPHLPKVDAKVAAIPGLSLRDLALVARAMPSTIEEATSHFRALARSRLQGVGRVIDPRFGWGDLVLNEEVEGRLRRIAFEARSRSDLLASDDSARLFAGSAGLSALFSGPPGVGKSMAAQVIARDLGVNLLVVDLAIITSKYIGETAKNMTEAFRQARLAGAVLLFDEADALFAKRTDVKDSNDRHANADTGHLLQLLEGHDGVAILATNRRAAIDPAFCRRLRHGIDFPRPEASERARIWALSLVALSAPIAEEENALRHLAERHDLSPAQIKGAVLTAAYAAHRDGRAIRLADLEEGSKGELIKEGRAAASVQPLPVRAGRAVMRG